MITPKHHSTMITPKQKIGSRRCCCCCFPWQVGMKKSMAKTVPLEEEEGLEFADMKAYTKVHSSSWKWRSKSKSNSFNNTQINSTLNQSLSQHDTRQHALSLPSSKRQHVVNKTTGRDAQKQKQDHVTGVCMVIISLVSMIVWGGLGSIVCTTSFMYLIPFLKTTKKIPWLMLQTTTKSSKDVAVSHQ
ncbi:hypothetical protein ACSQ67_022173 [Phaseolus vulgaris]